MSGKAHTGDWVEVRNIVLEPGKRAPQVPEDTRLVPLECRVRGFAAESAVIGAKITIRTAAGRQLRGILAEINPAYSHGYGEPTPELSAIAAELRTILETTGRD